MYHHKVYLYIVKYRIVPFSKCPSQTDFQKFKNKDRGKRVDATPSLDGETAGELRTQRIKALSEKGDKTWK